MSIDAIFQTEREKLFKIFQDVDEAKSELVEGLIDDAAFLKAENDKLKKSMKSTGMVMFHPKNNNMQKTPDTAKQYLKNVNSYAVIIRTLNGVLNTNEIDPYEDDLVDFE